MNLFRGFGKLRFVVASLISVLALPLAAQNADSESSAGTPPPQGTITTTPPEIGPDTYGLTQNIYLWVPAAAFVPRDTSSNWTDVTGTGNLYLSTAGGGGVSNDLWAPVNLPAGADLLGVRFYWCDTNSSGSLYGWFTQYPEANFDGFSDLISATTGAAATPGCTSTLVGPASPVTIDNYNNMYNVIVRVSTTGTTLRFRGARLYYRLQMSPAPASASFTDVGTTHWAFQAIEALKASGITGGCTPSTKFCPDDYVTRAQMATFLARALGLHWY